MVASLVKMSSDGITICVPKFGHYSVR